MHHTDPVARRPGPEHSAPPACPPHHFLGGVCANSMPVSMFFLSTGMRSATPFCSTGDSGPRPSTSSTPLGPRRTCRYAALQQKSHNIQGDRPPNTKRSADPALHLRGQVCILVSSARPASQAHSLPLLHLLHGRLVGEAKEGMWADAAETGAQRGGSAMPTRSSKSKAQSRKAGRITCNAARLLAACPLVP